MKRAGLTIFLLSLSMPWMLGQSVDRFIRIVGTSSHTFEANGIKAEINLSEIPASDFKKTEAVPIDAVYAGFMEAIKMAGLPDSSLSSPDVDLTKSFSSGSRTYNLTLTNPQQLQALVNNPPSGVRVNNILYTYNPIDPKLEQQLIGEAIEDAKRKAENISNGIDMKLGKLLNIEDISSGCCGEIKDSRESKTPKTYNVNVTFELKDK